MLRNLLLAVVTVIVVVARAESASVPGVECKCLPGDDCWATIQQWKELNATVGGNLIQTVPLASQCHDPNYNETACATLRDQWLSPTIHLNSSSSAMAPFFANQSCDAFQPRTFTCTLGPYVRYAVRARQPADVAATVIFAARHRFRLVIRNTGHDYLGRSTGAGASFDVQLPPGSYHDHMMDVVDAYHAALPEIVDAGAMSIYFFGAGFLRSPATTFFNKTRAEAEAILQPFLHATAALNATVTPTFTQLPSYFDHYAHYFGHLPARSIQGVTFIGVALDVSQHASTTAAVLPQWRKAIVSASLTLPWSLDVPFADMRAAQDRITDDVQPLVDRATPGGGAYMNEADFQQPDFKQVFFGDNYDRLRDVKRAWDPNGLFYAIAGVDSDRWEERTDGRLCKAYST